MSDIEKEQFRILVADDDVLIRKDLIAGLTSELMERSELENEVDRLAEKLFSQPGPSKRVQPAYDIVDCSQGAEAVEIVKQSIKENNPFAVAFLDVRMPPGISGIEAAKKIRAMDPLIRIVFVTGYSSVGPAEIAHEVAPEHKILYIQKPFHPHEVAQCAASQSVSWDVENRLTQSERQYRRLLESLPHGIQETDLKGTITYVNPAYLKIMHYEANELTGTKIWDYLENEEEEESLPGYYSHIIHNRPAPTPYFSKIKTNKGSVIDVQVDWNYAYDNEGALRGCTSVITDITKQVLMEKQLRHNHKMEAIGTLAGGIAHDFNNILMSITGNAELSLIKSPPESSINEHLNTIISASERAADLARQLLAYSGRGKFIVEQINVNNMAKEMPQILSSHISSSIELKLDLSENAEEIAADVTQVRQLYMNLLLNAAQAITDKSGRGRINIKTGTIEICENYPKDTFVAEELSEGTHTYIEVKDNGCGMDEATLSKMFDPFFTTKPNSHGLGMSASLGMIRGHKGAIKVESEPGRGTTVTAVFPSSQAQAYQENPEPLEDPLEVSEHRETKGTILVIDDEKDLIDLNVMFLERNGFNVLTAQDGREGLNIFSKDPGAISMVLLDMMMPHMNGDEVFSKMRKIRPDIKVLLASGYSKSEIADGDSLKGLAGFIKKPYQLKQLISKIHKITNDTNITDLKVLPEIH